MYSVKELYNGIHNIIGVPIVIGKNYDEFPEAIRLRDLAGLFSIRNAPECSETLNKLVANKDFRTKTGMISGHFVNKNTGATAKIMRHIAQ